MAALGYEITTEPEDANNSQVLPFLLHTRAGARERLETYDGTSLFGIRNE